MEVPRGVNLVGMSLFPLHVGPLYRFIQKKVYSKKWRSNNL